MSSEGLGDLLKDEYMKIRVREVLESLVVKMDSVVRGYLVAVQSAMVRYYGIKPVMEINSSMFQHGVEYHITMYIDPKDIKRIEEITKRELEKKYMRLKALRKILADELKNIGGEENALLSNMHPSAREGIEETGGAGAKIRGKKRRSSVKGSDESDI
jgi:hypothetical protein